MTGRASVLTSEGAKRGAEPGLRVCKSGELSTCVSAAIGWRLESREDWSAPLFACARVPSCSVLIFRPT